MYIFLLAIQVNCCFYCKSCDSVTFGIFRIVRNTPVYFCCSTMRFEGGLYRMGLFLQLFCLFYRMNDHPQSDIPKPENTGLLDQILNYIELHLSEDLSLASISAQFMVSQSTVSQLFKKQLDTGFYKIVTQRRLIESKNLINSGFPLKEVAEQCGFCDYSVFYKAFVKEYGISPRSFRTREKETHDFY